MNDTELNTNRKLRARVAECEKKEDVMRKQAQWESDKRDGHYEERATLERKVLELEEELAALKESQGEPVELAIKFHEAYERLAPSFGYSTRPDTKTFRPDSQNGRLMVAVCAELLHQAPTIPEGWQLVPITPPFELLQKMHLMYWRDHGRTEELSFGWHAGSKPLWEKTYAAMLAAAPQPTKEKV